MNKLQRLVLDLKANEDPAKHFAIPIYDERNRIGSLQCLDRLYAKNPFLVPELVKWRRASMQWYLTQFTATKERTSRWINTVVIPSPDRILFLIQAGGHRYGHYGAIFHGNGKVELDNGLRGEDGGPKGLMTYAEIALLCWLFGPMKMKKAALWVFSNNEPTFRWHYRVGYRTGTEWPLYKYHKENGDVDYSPYSGHAGERGIPADFSYVELTITPRELLKKHPWVSKYYTNG